MTILTVRTDDEVDAALEVLTAQGQTKSEAIRQAVIGAARERRAELLRVEAARLLADDADRAEASRVLADMEHLRAW